MSRNRLIMAGVVIQKEIKGLSLEDIPMAYFGLPLRTLNILEEIGIFTFGDFANIPKDVLLNAQNFGLQTYIETNIIIANSGFFQ